MISIIIPLYNKEVTILNTISSVINQTFQDYEIIIVDDGSTDDGVNQIVNNFNDKRIRIFKQSNQGVSVARNTGVSFAKSSYVAFLDGDDEWEPEYLSNMHQAIIKFPDAGMYCSAGKVRSKGVLFLRGVVKTKDDLLEIDYFQNPHVFTHTSATIVNKRIFQKSGGFPVGMKRNQDFACFFSIALFSSKVIYANKHLSIYNGDIEGQATQQSFSSIANHVINRFNWVHGNYLKIGKNNKTYIIFLKYELRHYFKIFLKNKDYKIIDLFIECMEPSILKEFSFLEIALLKNKSFRIISLFYLNLTKVIWRLNDFPIA